MFGSLGGAEIALILVLALLLFGPRKLPQIGRMVGKSLSEFRRATHDFKLNLEQEVRIEEGRPSRPPTPQPEAQDAAQAVPRETPDPGSAPSDDGRREDD
jgi:sec-independent protein translocase protein TatB